MGFGLNKKEGCIKWFASIVLVIAGCLIALKINIGLIYVSYYMFALGHTIWICIFIKSGERSLVFSNIFFLFIDIVGIIKWI